MLRELRLPDGGLASAQDADTNGVEGLTFTWTEEEGVPGRAAAARSSTAARSSAASSTPSCAHGCSRAASAAAARPRRQGARVVERPRARGARRGRAPARARRLARRGRGLGEFLLGPLSREDGRLSRSWREGKVSGEGFLDDYANVAHGLFELHVATGELRWLHEARRLALLAVELFADPEHGGFFLAPTDGEELVARTKDLDDNPMPSGNSMLAHVLLRLSRIWGDDELERLGGVGAPARRADARPRPGRVRLGALRARPLALAAP